MGAGLVMGGLWRPEPSGSCLFLSFWLFWGFCCFLPNLMSPGSPCSTLEQRG